MPKSGDNTSAGRCKPVAGTVDETRTPAMPVGIPCSGHVRPATGITGFQPREEVKTSSRTAQAKHRRRTPDGRFADELNSFGFPDAATLSAYEQQTSQIPVLQRLQKHGKITPPPITLPDGWTEAGTKHDGNADG